DGDDHAVADRHAPRERGDGDRRARRLVPVRPEVAEPTDRDAVVGVGRAARARARAVLGRIAGRGRAATHGRRGQEGVGWTRGARPRAGLGHVAGTGRRPAHDAGVARRVLAGHVRAVALIEGARVGVRRAGGPRRLLGVRRAGGAGPRAALGDIAFARRRAAHGAAVPRRVLAGHVGAIALVQGAGVGVRRTGGRRRLLGVRRAGGADTVAGLRQVAFARRRAAHRAGVPRRVRAGRAAAVADVARADVAVVGARCPVRLEGVGRAGGARAGAALGDVALARRRPAHRARVPRRVLAGGVR